MAFVHGKDSRVIMDDFAMSGYLRGVDTDAQVELADTTVFGDEGHKFTPGLDNGSLTFDGVWDSEPSSSGADFAVEAKKQAADASVVTVAPEGFTLGNRVKSAEARINAYGITSPVADAVGFSAGWQTEGQVDAGVSLHDLTAETATGNGTAHDGAASSSNGGVSFLHVTANTMNDTTVIKIQDSPDNSVWSDLATFTTVAAATTAAERIAASGTVDRYLRAVRTCNGTGSITFAAGFSRR